MISSVNAFSGLSASDISKLFGANPPSPSSAKTTTTSQLAATSLTIPSVNGPAAAIQAIVVQAQVEKAQMPGGGSQVSASVETAYIGRYAAESSIQAFEELVTQTPDAPAAQTQEGSAPQAPEASETETSETTAVSATWTHAGSVGRTSWAASESVTTVSSASASESTGNSLPNPQADQTDDFQMTVTFGDVSIAVGFDLEGIGLTKASSNAYGYISVGQGNLEDSFNIGVANSEGQGVFSQFTIMGLNGAQADELGAAFGKAAATLHTAASADAGYIIQTSEAWGVPDPEQSASS